MRKVKVAATQMSCSWDVQENIKKAEEMIHSGSRRGCKYYLITGII